MRTEKKRQGGDLSIGGTRIPTHEDLYRKGDTWQQVELGKLYSKARKKHDTMKKNSMLKKIFRNGRLSVLENTPIVINASANKLLKKKGVAETRGRGQNKRVDTGQEK